MLCQFCNEYICLDSWVDRTREELRSLNLHQTEKHKVTRGRGLMLVVGNLTMEEIKFVGVSLGKYFVNMEGYPSTNVSCACCGDNIHLERELSDEVRIYKLKIHIEEKHNVMISGGILTDLNMLSKDEMSKIIEMLLLRYGFRTHVYNRYHAAISAQNKQDAENENNMKMPILELKLENNLKNPALQEGMRKKNEKKCKGIKKGDSTNSFNRAKKMLKCEFCPYTQFKPYKLKQHIRIHTKKTIQL